MSKETKTIEDKMAELRELAAWFESDDFLLEEASKRFDSASRLAKEIEHDLTEMENTVTVLKRSFEEV